MEKLIELKSIYKTYLLGKEKISVLRDINLVIHRGDFLAITGASGSGKSTLMNILGFLDAPDSGSYVFDGAPYHNYSGAEVSKIRGEKIGFIFQGFLLLPNLTALQNVELPLIYNHVRRKDRRRMALAALRRVGLEDRIDHKPSQLSGGQKQRVAIARAIALSPPLILADEPTGNLDPRAGDEVIRYLTELNRTGTTVVIITHDEHIAAEAAHRIVIRNGQLSHCGAAPDREMV